MDLPMLVWHVRELAAVWTTTVDVVSRGICDTPPKNTFLHAFPLQLSYLRVSNKLQPAFNFFFVR